MKHATFVTFALLGVAACGDDGGGGGGGGGADAPVDVTVNTTITISGVASEITATGRVAQAGVQIVVLKVSDDSVIAMTTSDAAGAFTVSAPSNGAAIDGYLKATKSGLKDTYLYPPGPLATDFSGATTLMLKANTQSLANQLAGAAAPDPAKGWIGVLVVDGPTAAAMPVMGVTITASPTGEIHYNSSAGLPQAQAMSTATDGIGYVMNVPAGQVMISATKTGTTFHAHSINARADKVTLTLVTP
ncbi:MAG: hypothetical protein IPQ07_13965 [Myxococcales bacterium]|nr:hypothetical protein [Myxococcales bacterium]